MLTRGRRCPLLRSVAWPLSSSIQARRSTPLRFVLSSRPRCLNDFTRNHASTTPGIGDARSIPYRASRIALTTHCLRTVRVPVFRTCTVLRRTIHVPRCIKTRRTPASQQVCANRRKATRHGLAGSIPHDWHGLCIKPCHRINVDPARVQYKVLAVAQVRTTASPELSHRLGSRDAVFISAIASPDTRRRRPTPSPLRTPRS
jgi:hypothetical protein